MEKNKDISVVTIQQYLHGQLDPKQMHQLEKQALNDPFLADALEGYARTEKPAAHQLSILQRQLEERIAMQQEEKNYFNFSWQRLSIAAAAGLMFITAGLLFWMNTPDPAEVASQPKKVDVELTPEKIVPQNSIVQNNIAKVETYKNIVPAPAKKTIPNEPIPITESRMAYVSKEAISPVGAEEFKIAAPRAGSASAETTNALISSAMALKVEGPTVTGGSVTTFRGNPLPGAAVGIKGTQVMTFTDENGRFKLPDSVKGTLVIGSIGYQTKELGINPGDKLAITLEEDQNALSEVVVTARVDRKSRGAAIAPVGIQPKGGRERFDQYTARNAKYPRGAEKIAGEVILSFSVDSKGKPENIRVVKSLNTALDNEAIRVLKAGPDWELNGVNVSSETQVIIKFKP